MTAEQLWKEYCEKKHVDVNTPYEAWQFGAEPDRLAALVMIGAKTATASSFDLYAAEDEPVPKVGDCNVLLDTNDEALCVIRDTGTRVVPYREVSAEHAYQEGEGDRTLKYWRNVHWPFFMEEHADCGIPFTEDSPVLCEEFEVRYSLYEVTDLTDDLAHEIVGWKYEGDWAVYNMPTWEECEAAGLSIASAEKRHNRYYAVRKSGELLGFFRIMERNELVELGVGIKPELCGQHHGGMLLALAMAKIEEKYGNVTVQLKVRPFNTRAVKCYGKAGFKTVGTCYEDRSAVPGEMLIMQKNTLRSVDCDSCENMA